MNNDIRKTIDKIKNLGESNEYGNNAPAATLKNVVSVWDRAPVKVRDSIKKLTNNDIDVNKSFNDQTINGKNEIIKNFTHSGAIVYTEWGDVDNRYTLL